MNKNKKTKSDNVFTFIGRTFKEGDIFTKLSFFVMGLSNLVRGQIIKGLLFLSMELGFIFYMIMAGLTAFTGLSTLGTKTQEQIVIDKAPFIKIIKGDNSMLMLLYGVVAIFVIATFLFMWKANIKAAIEAQKLKEKGSKLPSFIDDVRAHFDAKLHRTLLFFPMMGVLVFTVLPLVFMILIAFTNFDNTHQPPGNLFTWVGLKNFRTVLFSGQTISKTFWPVLGWTIIWAILATGLNYIFGMLLAMLINRKGVKFKGLWRTIFVLSIAVPQFVTLLIMRNMLATEGPINGMLLNAGLISKAIPFLTQATWARVTVLIVNLWIGVPYSMLITTGILMNIPEDIYESAKIDGASPFIMFVKITLPYVLFVTGPYLIQQFIGNINNFNVIYLLTTGNPSSLDYYQAGKTDLLVTWLYKLTVNRKDYSFAATIGILVFILSATVSLIAYRRTSAYKSEEDFQ
ncbi:carbohydrate ABC transporter permease [Anaerosporobacter faecicola]|uniref:carbohydrate ABC transporter permease n=1 Tax=Anaerosporobacter faecicola TaxID=2718714 RepID=UPI001EE54B58|nr:sugar ABC transporter permease [Anaerosporobacter faecicola]